MSLALPSDNSPDPRLRKYKAGQSILCLVLQAEKDGYTAYVDGSVPAFLHTKTELKPGDEVFAKVVSISNRVLLTDRNEPTNVTFSDSDKQPKFNFPKFNEQFEQYLTQTEADRGGSGQPPRKTALGYSGDEDGDLKPGQSVVCEVVKAEPGCYEVLISKRGLKAFLPTQALLRTGEQILAQFVSVHGGRIFVSARFSGDSALTNSPSHEGGSYRHFYIPDASAPRAQNDSLKSRRATDLMVPPINHRSVNEFKIEDHDLEWLITDLEGQMLTGCLQATCQSRLSRSAMLLYRGRAIGCIATSRSTPDNQPTEVSLQSMLADLECRDTEVRVYDLPENIVLPMSALFLGYPVQRNDNYDGRAYTDYICNWFEGKKQTACLVTSLPSHESVFLSFIYNGQFCGAFSVEDQQFNMDREFVYELLRRNPNSNVEVSILPPEMTSSAVRFGYSLSMAKKRMDGS